MLIRLNAPRDVPLSFVASWAEYNRIPVIYREVLTVWAPANRQIETRQYAIFSRRSISLIKVNPAIRWAIVPRFHILTRPQDELLLVVRFGLERVNEP